MRAPRPGADVCSLDLVRPSPRARVIFFFASSDVIPNDTRDVPF